MPGWRDFERKCPLTTVVFPIKYRADFFNKGMAIGLPAGFYEQGLQVSITVKTKGNWQFSAPCHWMFYHYINSRFSLPCFF